MNIPLLHLVDTNKTIKKRWIMVHLKALNKIPEKLMVYKGTDIIIIIMQP